MHWRAHADQMRDFAVYDGPGGVVGGRPRRARRAGGGDARPPASPATGSCSTPGLGFAKHGEHNWELLRDLDALDALGCPLLVGASRKSFLGRLLADAARDRAPVDEREHANTALDGPAGPARGRGACGCTTYAPPATPCAWSSG